MNRSNRTGVDFLVHAPISCHPHRCVVLQPSLATHAFAHAVSFPGGCLPFTCSYQNVKIQ